MHNVVFAASKGPCDVSVSDALRVEGGFVERLGAQEEKRPHGLDQGEI